MKTTNTHDVILSGIERLEKARCTPSTTQHDERLLLGVEWQLLSRVTVELRDIVESTSANENTNKGCSSQDL